MCNKVATIKKIATDALNTAQLAQLTDELNTHLIMTERHEPDRYVVTLDDRSRRPVWYYEGLLMGPVTREDPPKVVAMARELVI